MQWDAALREIAHTVRAQPLKYLQNVGGATVPFLYQFAEEPGWIELRPGVASNLRKFQGLVHQIARAGWVRHVRENPRNSIVIGGLGDLEAFMFGIARSSLEPAREFLMKLQSRRCFYCGETLGADGDVDHFVPWSKYPRDLAHNFVLAHATCNRSKSDMLAGLVHVEHWRQRNARVELRRGDRRIDRCSRVDDSRLQPLCGRSGNGLCVRRRRRHLAREARSDRRAGRQVYLADRFARDWASVPFLIGGGYTAIPDGMAPQLDAAQPATFFLWPYEDWAQTLSTLSAPVRLKVSAGPLAKGDLDAQPQVGYLQVQIEPIDGANTQPEAQFENGLAAAGAFNRNG